MSKPAMRSYPAEFKERAVTLVVEVGQPIAQTARDLGMEELKRLRKDNARLKEEREIRRKAAAYFAPQLP